MTSRPEILPVPRLQEVEGNSTVVGATSGVFFLVGAHTTIRSFQGPPPTPPTHHPILCFFPVHPRKKKIDERKRRGDLRDVLISTGQCEERGRGKQPANSGQQVKMPPPPPPPPTPSAFRQICFITENSANKYIPEKLS